MRVRIPFESTAEQRIRAMRTRSREELAPELIGYTDAAGETRGLTGDEVGPYVYALARATDDGEAVVEVAKGDPQILLCDTNGRIYTRDAALAGAASRYSSAALESQASVKTSSGIAWELRMLLTSGVAADRWLMAFDAAAAVVNGATPIWRTLLPNPGSQRAEVWDGFQRPLGFSTGLVVAISTTEVTLTLAGNEALFEILYV